MGLLDSIMGAVLSQAQGPSTQGGGLGAALGTLLGNDGGLGGLLARFEQAGLGELAASWVGRGENLPVSAGQIRDVLGSDAVGRIAAQLGVDPAQATRQLASLLPGVIDHLTPDGAVPEGGVGDAGALLGKLAGMLQKN